MSGWNTLRDLLDLKEKIHALGLQITPPKYGGEGHHFASVTPRDEELPIYGREAPLYTGTLEQIQVFIEGIKWARNYDEIMRVSTSKTRARKEQDFRNKQLIQRLKGEPVERLKDE